MKIKGTCQNCGREVLAQQVIEAGGHCPWCGIAFNSDYASLVVRSLAEAEEHGERLEEALDQIAEIEEMKLTLDNESVLAPLQEALRTIRRRRARV